MTAELSKDSIDIGIVIKDSEASLKFYRDLLGFNHVGDMPAGAGGTMHRLMCGTTLVKLVNPGRDLGVNPAAGGIQGAYGYRYWTISVSNLDEITKECADAGYNVTVQPREIRPGVSISMVEDPDGNIVEFIKVVSS